MNTYSITWSSVDFDGALTIQASADGRNWVEVATSVPNTGTFEWTIPDYSAAPFPDAYLRIFGPNYDPVDTSEAFEIVPGEQSPITIVSPSANDLWYSGDYQYLMYEVANGVRAVALWYSIGGSSWHEITDFEENTKVHGWQIPFVEEPGTCRIRIADAEDYDAFVISDSFTIYPPKLYITSPTSGDSLTAGTDFTLLWDSYGQVGRLNIEFSSNDSNWTVLVHNTGDDGEEKWSIPPELVSSTSARLRIGKNHSNQYYDTTEYFTILSEYEQPSIIIVNPKGPTILEAKSTCLIEWNWTGDIPEVRLEWGTPPGMGGGDGNWSIIQQNTDNSGSYEWQIPDTVLLGARIRISSSDGSVSALNAGPLLIERATSSMIGRPISERRVQVARLIPSNELEITVYIRSPENVTIRLFDLRGRAIILTEEALVQPGHHVFRYDLTSIASNYLLEVRLGCHCVRRKLFAGP